MIYILHKITHFITANSRHGTHSPFVYALADELIYNKNIVRSNALIEDIVHYYESKGINKTCFLIADSNTYSIGDLAKLQDNYFMIFIKNIYSNKSVKEKWSRMKVDDRFVVLIDLFEFGIVCKRTTQPKENFKLRYPYSYY